MHPDITKTIAALRVDEKHAAAAAARLVRQARPARAGRAGRSLPLPGSAAAAGGRDVRLPRLLGRWRGWVGDAAPAGLGDGVGGV
jgi:hypothetical protein